MVTSRPTYRLVLCLALAAFASSPFDARAGEQPKTINEALELFDEKRFDDVAEALDAIAQGPVTPAERKRARTLASEVRTFKAAWDAGTRATKQRDFEPAIRAFEQALELCEAIKPDGSVAEQLRERRLAPLYVLHGNSSLKNTKYSEAYRSFKKALQHKPDYDPARKGLTKLGAQAKKLYYEGYVSQYSDLEAGTAFQCREYPLNPAIRWPVQVQPALQHFDASEFDQAEAELQPVAASDAPSEVLENAGYLLRQLAEFRLRWQSGLDSLEAGNHEQAVSDFQEAMQRASCIFPRGRVYRAAAHRLTTAALAAAEECLEREEFGHWTAHAFMTTRPEYEQARWG